MSTTTMITILNKCAHNENDRNQLIKHSSRCNRSSMLKKTFDFVVVICYLSDQSWIDVVNTS